MTNLRIGLIGAGGMGSFHARTLHRLPGVEIAVIADPIGDAAERLASELDATAMMDPTTLASSGAVDGLVIASPDDTHADLALAALSVGTPVLCEKPLATSVVDAQRVVSLEAEQPSRRLQLGFMREFDLAHTQLVAAVRPLGRLHHVRCVHVNTNSDERPVEVIVGQSIVHDLHTIRFVSEAEITSVTARATHRAAGTVRHVVVLCALSSGGHATVEFDDSGFAYDVVVEATADDGSVLTGPQIRPTVRIDGQTRTTIGDDWFGRFADAYRFQDRAWIESIRSGVAVGPDAFDGLVAQAVVEAILESLRSGQTVSVTTPERPSQFAG